MKSSFVCKLNFWVYMLKMIPLDTLFLFERVVRKYMFLCTFVLPVNQIVICMLIITI
ncbi:hypothetical protein BDF14DRAFT_925447 [Spinellus fusiger]|nr:hypothetical protein BDF14DRAFT_925447 [Spinellus fusiger]